MPKLHKPKEDTTKAVLRVKERMNASGLRVKARREELKLSQDNICARLTDVTEGKWKPKQRDLWRIEAGTRKIGDIELIALALALETSPLWLLTGGGDGRERPSFDCLSVNVSGSY